MSAGKGNFYGRGLFLLQEKLRHEFDRASILTIDGASANYFKELDNRGKREISFFELSEAQLGKLYTVDEYSVENFFFRYWNMI